MEDYPDAPTGGVVEELHGQSIADPYRWLEDSDSPETRAWIEEQNHLTFGVLETLPGRAAIGARLEKLWNYEKHGLPVKRGDNYFFARNDGLQNQSPYYVTSDLSQPARLLLDPNTLSSDGTTSIGQQAASRDGRIFAYAVSQGGSDWRTVRFRDVASGRDLEDKLEWVKFSGIAWSHDNAGIYYSRYDAPAEGDDKLQQVNRNQRVYYHQIGQPQSQDRLVYERPDNPEWGFGCNVTEDGSYLINHVWQGTHRENNLFYQDLSQPDAPFVELLAGFRASYDYIGNDGTRFWLQTDDDAARGRVVAIDAANPQAGLQELIPESEDTLEEVHAVGGHFIASYLKDAQTVVRIFDTSGKLLRELQLPGIGSANGFSGRQDSPETFYSFTSFTHPTTIYRYDVASDESVLLHTPKVDFDPADYEVNQVFYRSKDDTRVPMFLIHKKGLKKDGNRPVMLYGYGGFNISLTPSFGVSSLLWLELGGVYAVANLRGGGEYGEAWHDGGMKDQKQNVFDDFIAGAEWLMFNNYTRPSKIAIAGGSNGGLLVGACMTQRPELFGACIPSVGVFDMLRFHKFTIGWAWVSDYGSPDDAQDFKTLLEYSPLHNVKEGTCYPPTLIFTGDHDDRVVPAHSFKYAATLQAAQGCRNPVLIRIDTRAGHGAGKSTSMLIEEIADRFAFLVKSLDMELPAQFQSASK
ncbi:MAG: prolyl oligopeptidase family serine peptidase [Planctomycetota bacterium]